MVAEEEEEGEGEEGVEAASTMIAEEEVAIAMVAGGSRGGGRGGGGVSQYFLLSNCTTYASFIGTASSCFSFSSSSPTIPLSYARWTELAFTRTFTSISIFSVTSSFLIA